MCTGGDKSEIFGLTVECGRAIIRNGVGASIKDGTVLSRFLLIDITARNISRAEPTGSECRSDDILAVDSVPPSVVSYPFQKYASANSRPN